jgi:hypothetical protein
MSFYRWSRGLLNFWPFVNRSGDVLATPAELFRAWRCKKFHKKVPLGGSWAGYSACANGCNAIYQESALPLGDPRKENPGCPSKKS